MRGYLSTGELSVVFIECHFKESGVFVALVEYGHGTYLEFRAWVRNGEKAIIKIIYANLLIGIPSLDIHSDMEICAKLSSLDVEVTDADVVRQSI